MTNLESYLEGLSWTSDDGTGTTSFQGVYTYPNIIQVEGYPYVVISDGEGSGEAGDSRSIDFDTTITVSICVNYGTIDKQTEDEKMEEAMLRLRESWDYLKTQLFKIDTMDTIGVDWNYEPNYVDDYDDVNGVYKRVITLLVKENISRG